MVAVLSSASLINCEVVLLLVINCEVVLVLVISCEVVLVLVISWEVGKKMEMAQIASHSTKMETPGR